MTLAAHAGLKLCMHRTSVFCRTARGCFAFIGRAPCDTAEESHLCPSESQSVAGWSTGSCCVTNHRDVPPLQTRICPARCMASAKCMQSCRTSPPALKPQRDSCVSLDAGHDERLRT